MSTFNLHLVELSTNVNSTGNQQQKMSLCFGIWVQKLSEKISEIIFANPITFPTLIQHHHIECFCSKDVETLIQPVLAQRGDNPFKA